MKNRSLCPASNGGRAKAAALAALTALALAISLSPSRTAFAQSKPAARPKAEAEGDYYYCLMDTDVRSKKPGKCPKCGMELRPHRAAHAAHPAASADPAPTGAQPAVGEVVPTSAQAVPTSPSGAGERAARGEHEAARMSIPDVELLDQDGRKVRFYTDLVKGRTVAINFIFTTCTTICPPLGATFRRVEEQLGERAGRDVRLISVSVDPATDTPERMKAWGAKFRAGAGWTLVTGPKPAIDELLLALGAATASPADHTPAVLIGNDASGQWTRSYGLARPTQLVQLIDAALAGKLDTSAKELSTSAKESQ